MPLMNPCTATFALICRLLMRIKVCGSISEPPIRAGSLPRFWLGSVARSRSSAHIGRGVPSRHVTLFHMFDQPVDHRVDPHPVGLGTVAEEDPVSHGGM